MHELCINQEKIPFTLLYSAKCTFLLKVERERGTIFHNYSQNINNLTTFFIFCWGQLSYIFSIVF